MRCSVGCLFRADGSARFSLGNTDVIASVTGPASVPLRKESINKATIEVSFHSKLSGQERTYQDVERTLQRLFDHCIIGRLHPSTLITITIQVMNDDGCLLGCAINAATLALLDAGVPMGYTPAAVTISEFLPASLPSPTDPLCLCWPTKEQLQSAACTATFVFSNLPPSPPPPSASPVPAPAPEKVDSAPIPPQVVLSQMTGRLVPLPTAPAEHGMEEVVALEELTRVARDGALELWTFFRECLAAKLSKLCARASE